MLQDAAGSCRKLQEAANSASMPLLPVARLAAHRAVQVVNQLGIAVGVEVEGIRCKVELLAVRWKLAALGKVARFLHNIARVRLV